MKTIKYIEEFNCINGKPSSLILLGADDCIHCMVAKKFLEEAEENKKYKLQYYYCNDVNIISNLDYNIVPIVILITSTKKIELIDKNIIADIKAFNSWIIENTSE
jgi:hypothetical protein